MANLRTGDKAPDFKLTDQGGNNVNLADFKGRKLLLYFYIFNSAYPSAPTQFFGQD